MALSRSRTRSCAVRSRLRIEASSGDAESRTSPASSTLRPMRAASSGAGSSSSRRVPRCGPLDDRRRAAKRSVASSVAPSSSSSPAVRRPPRGPHARVVARMSRAPPIERLRLVFEEPSGLVRLVLDERRRERLGKRAQLAGELARRLEGGQRGQLLVIAANSSARRVPASAADAASASATRDVGVIGDPVAKRARRPRRPRRRRRSGDRSGRAIGPRRGSRRIGPARRSLPSRRRSTPSARPTLPGPDARRVSRHRGPRRVRARATPSSMSSARISTASGLSAGPRHDVEAVVEPVDQVHVAGGRVVRTSWRCAPSGHARSGQRDPRDPGRPRPRRSAHRRRRRARRARGARRAGRARAPLPAGRTRHDRAAPGHRCGFVASHGHGNSRRASPRARTVGPGNLRSE